MTKAEQIKIMINGNENHLALGNNVIKAINWCAKEVKAKSKEEAEEAFFKTMLDFDRILSYDTTATYSISDKTNVYQCASVLLNQTEAFANYVKQELI